MIDCRWRLEKAKSPAAMLQENNPDATCMSIPPMYVVSCCTVISACVYIYIYNMPVSKIVTTVLLSLG